MEIISFEEYCCSLGIDNHIERELYIIGALIRFVTDEAGNRLIVAEDTNGEPVLVRLG